MDDAAARAFLSDAEVVHLATTSPDGAPILRTLNAVVVDGALCFHAAPIGEKSQARGRTAVVGAEQVVAGIPSYFVDPQRACPATTLYMSAQAHGIIESVDALDQKARVLEALMQKYQPEGGYAPFDVARPSFTALYQKEVAALWIARIRLDAVDGKAKLLQNRPPEERARICDKLWLRGLPGDARAIEIIRAANPDTPTPSFLAYEPPAHANRRATLHCAFEPRDLDGAVELLRDQYWNRGLHPPERIAGALLGSTAWVGARDQEGRVIACARAVSDGHRQAWIYDVAVAPAWRGCGLGKAVVRLILDHPRVRGASSVLLKTRDAQSLYQKFGFVESVTMQREMR
jgi:ribosomal protein S18 acetylase RimI-like enzyme/nitroimidazol reductase NimA-like FMN-containing flavoprotein (pyridoxamine 5'-phosphate oxidase superfamily)